MCFRFVTNGLVNLHRKISFSITTVLRQKEMIGFDAKYFEIIIEFDI